MGFNLPLCVLRVLFGEELDLCELVDRRYISSHSIPPETRRPTITNQTVRVRMEPFEPACDESVGVRLEPRGYHGNRDVNDNLAV